MLTTLLAGVGFAVIIGVVNYFSSSLHPGRVSLAGALFAVVTYFSLRRRQKRRQ